MNEAFLSVKGVHLSGQRSNLILNFGNRINVKQFMKRHAEFISASLECRLFLASKTDAYETLKRVQGDEVLKRLY
jgi:hypothetical protein